jgi:hypothetical protein
MSGQWFLLRRLVFIIFFFSVLFQESVFLVCGTSTLSRWCNYSNGISGFAVEKAGV